jgi:hypothetical protein
MVDGKAKKADTDSYKYMLMQIVSE